MGTKKSRHRRHGRSAKHPRRDSELISGSRFAKIPEEMRINPKSLGRRAFINHLSRIDSNLLDKFDVRNDPLMSSAVLSNSLLLNEIKWGEYKGEPTELSFDPSNMKLEFSRIQSQTVLWRIRIRLYRITKWIEDVSQNKAIWSLISWFLTVALVFLVTRVDVYLFQRPNERETQINDITLEVALRALTAKKMVRNDEAWHCILDGRGGPELTDYSSDTLGSIATKLERICVNPPEKNVLPFLYFLIVPDLSKQTALAKYLKKLCLRPLKRSDVDCLVSKIRSFNPGQISTLENLLKEESMSTE